MAKNDLLSYGYIARLADCETVRLARVGALILLLGNKSVAQKASVA